MVKRTTPDKVFQQYAAPIERALGCIASERLLLAHPRPLEVGPVHPLLLNRNQPVVLRGDQRLQFSAGWHFRIVHGSDLETDTFRIELVNYWYVLSSAVGQEILAFHWTPEANPAVTRTTPHLHVGSVNISQDAPITPKTFNKLHIPTGYVSIAAFVRFLIEELKVQPRHARWSEILDDAHLALAAPEPR